MNGINECCICLIDIEGEFRKLKCNHIFCKSCIKKWFSKTPQCPTCRRYNVDHQSSILKMITDASITDREEHINNVKLAVKSYIEECNDGNSITGLCKTIAKKGPQETAYEIIQFLIYDCNMKVNVKLLASFITCFHMRNIDFARIMMLNCNLKIDDYKKLIELVVIYSQNCSPNSIVYIIDLLQEFIISKIENIWKSYNIEDMKKDLIYMSSKHDNLNILIEALNRWDLPIVCYDSIIVKNAKNGYDCRKKKYTILLQEV